MSLPKNLKELCTPSLVYFVISIIGLTLSVIQNLGNTKRYCLGLFSCKVPSTILIFILKLIYILFWTWVLNLICKAGYKNIAWFLVLIPFLMMFVLLGLLIISGKK